MMGRGAAFERLMRAEEQAQRDSEVWTCGDCGKTVREVPKWSAQHVDNGGWFTGFTSCDCTDRPSTRAAGGDR